MGFTKWITRKGITGILARDVGNKYQMIHQLFPQLNPNEVSRVVSILYKNHNCIRTEFTREEITDTVENLTDPRDLTSRICVDFENLNNENLYILINRMKQIAQGSLAWRDTPSAIMKMEYDVISEELAKFGIPRECYLFLFR